MGCAILVPFLPLPLEVEPSTTFLISYGTADRLWPVGRRRGGPGTRGRARERRNDLDFLCVDSCRVGIFDPTLDGFRDF